MPDLFTFTITAPDGATYYEVLARGPKAAIRQIVPKAKWPTGRDAEPRWLVRLARLARPVWLFVA
jgi:hypothetical protein